LKESSEGRLLISKDDIVAMVPQTPPAKQEEGHVVRHRYCCRGANAADISYIRDSRVNREGRPEVAGERAQQA
jgi:hypothetical protein